MSKVYIKTDLFDRIIAIEGGYSISNIVDPENWILVDEGEGDKYNLCQRHYLEKPLVNNEFIYQYKFENGEIKERSQEEMNADYIELSATDSTEKRIAELEAQNAMLTECLLEISQIIYS